MTENQIPLEVKVWGDFACFTRPEMKVERVTYPVMTPSAARGTLEAIFWKPEFTWRILEIWVLKPIRYFSIRRNEINDRQSIRVAEKWVASGGGSYDPAEHRAQRHTLALRDVSYLIKALVELKPGAQDDVAKYRDQFRRRVETGRNFATPFLGCREFSAFFSKPTGEERPIQVSETLGTMLHDIEFDNDGSGRGTPRFFEAALKDGVLHVPAFNGVAEG